MERHFTLEYWIDDGWYVGKMGEIPGVFSQGKRTIFINILLLHHFHQ